MAYQTNFHPVARALAAIGVLSLVLSGGDARGDDQVPGGDEQAGAAETLTGEQTKFFESKIRPVLVRECYGCHSKQSGQSKGGLRVDTRRALLDGGDSGPAIVPGDLDSSLFFGAITHVDFVMPPKRKLSDEEIRDFRTWILDGAPDPRITKPVEAPAQTIDDGMIEHAQQTFWAYQTPVLDPPPKSQLDWARTPIDRFLEQKLFGVGLSPADDAPASVVLRRLCFDLVGLPPTPDQIRWFQSAYQDDAEAAIRHVADSLLESDRFGEHWGRHWLDVVRYAESTGREVNMTYPHAWRYRDYVIDAFNDDKPYDEFVQEQIAGDLLPIRDDAEWSEHLVATTFLAVGTKNVNEQSAAQFAADVADEQIDATTRVFLGTSVACARCHDHKFDPIRQSDYYAMAGIFRSTKTFFGNPPSQYGTFGGPQQRRNSSLILLPADESESPGKSYSPEKLAELHDQIREKRSQLAQLRSGKLPPNTRPGVTAQQVRLRLTNEIGQLSSQLSVVDEDGRPRAYCMGVQDRPTAEDAPLLVRGEIDQPSGRVRRGFPEVLSPADFEPSNRSSGRLELARWIGSDQNSLAARVMVNRVWSNVYGQGIVTTTEDFGMTGTPPSHPELLDYLAIRFVDAGWSVKTMVREMVTARAYRMASTFDEASHQRDPDNHLLWRSNVKRLGAESIRDAMLSAAGELDLKRPVASMVAEAGYVRVRSEQLEDPRDAIRRSIESTLTSRRQEFGPGSDRTGGGTTTRRGDFRSRLRGRIDGKTIAEMTAKVMQDGSLDSVTDNYRSVYLPVVRDFVPRSLEVFDFPDPSLVTGVRETSNTPNQALYMLNNPLTLRLSESFARRIIEAGGSADERIELAFMLAYGRPPNETERAASHRYLNESGLMPRSALASFCQSLFAAAEFRYLN